ncbi:MAG: glycoside hydrolase N-terminal domain-containing protein [Muribaculaceae bacterium]|nr:glycoside hydrolase N-terminal domain-containing protein [Muribaculaceae bacterium]
MKIRFLAAAVTAATMSLTTTASETMVWYGQPASKWMQALPLGNGRIGAMVYGGIGEDRIALNEISMWSGRHDPTSNDLCGKDSLAAMREAFFKGDHELGNQIGERNLTGRMTTFGTHVPLGDLTVRMSHPAGQTGNYSRRLDLENAVATVSYTCGDVTYTREYITDYPDDIMAVRFTASRPGCITATFGLDLLRDADVAVTADGLECAGTVDFPLHGPGGVNFIGGVSVSNEGGSVSQGDRTFAVTGADAVTVYIDIRTDYKHSDYKERCRNTLAKGKAAGWDRLLSSHLSDYTSLFGRMDIDLGKSLNSSLPTDTRLALVNSGSADPGFDALFFQYGRYMLIASSRDHGLDLCSNLQGIWNDNRACNMPWTCDYHLDVNIQQNYWASNRTNLAECNKPLFDYIGLLARHGSETARKMYGSGGWVAHTVANAWGYTAPGWGVSWGMNVTGGAWIATHLWSHYLYTRDDEYLRTTGYPLLKSTAEFFVDYMTPDPNTGYLVTGPSISPENGYISPKGNQLSLDMMPTVDRTLVYEIYTACIESSKILGVDKKFRARLEKDIKKLPPLKIGKDGQLDEWYSGVRRADPSHRHSSHLLGLFPMNHISVTHTPALAKASLKGLRIQTSDPSWEDTEWSTANMLCYHARLKNSEEAHGWLQNLFKVFTRENLMTVSPAGVAMAEEDIFSFDATEASVAGMCEMLLQSHDGYLEFLPALPEVWKTGSVRGLCAEGGLQVDLSWTDGRLVSATVTADKDCSFIIKGEEKPVKLKKGEKYIHRI